jgi:hypothetical protein
VAPTPATGPGPYIPLTFERGVLPLLVTLVRAKLLFLAGTMPVLSVALYVFGVLPMTDAAMFAVIPLALISTVLILRGSPEARWALRGFGVGLVAVVAYDSVRLPMVWAHIWPDFIPRMGGWILGSSHPSVLVGYTWRLLGDGDGGGIGIGMAFFVFCGVVCTIRPKFVTRAPMLLSIGYGIFVWTGLLVTVVVPPTDNNCCSA